MRKRSAPISCSNENEVLAILLQLSTTATRAPLDAALASARMLVAPFLRGYLYPYPSASPLCREPAPRAPATLALAGRSPVGLGAPIRGDLFLRQHDRGGFQ